MAEERFFNWSLARRKGLMWFLAIVITLASAVYQRMTGPTYPVKGQLEIDGQPVKFKFLRSENVGTDAPVVVFAPDTQLSGYVRFKRYKSHDEWSQIPLQREGERLVANLPQQPAAGKLIYEVALEKDGKTYVLTHREPVILRYKGAVPPYILIPHIFFMFMGMLFSNRAALEALDERGKFKRYLYWTIGFFFIGGLVLAPIVQKFAFDAFWTGVPFGYDLTDNKTLIAAIGWAIAWWNNRGERQSRKWIFIAALLMLAVYLIPHSVLGSEIDYTKLEGTIPQQ